MHLGAASSTRVEIAKRRVDCAGQSALGTLAGCVGKRFKMPTQAYFSECAQQPHWMGGRVQANTAKPYWGR